MDQSDYTHLSLKGIPTPELMEKIDKMKRVIKDDIFHPWRLVPLKRWIHNLCTEKSKMLPVIDVNNLTISSGHIALVTVYFFNSITLIPMPDYARLWYIVLSIVGSDMAYRLRIQDLLNECDKNELYQHPRKELKRVWQIYLRRETVIPTYMIPKARKVFNLMLLALWIPKYKRAFRHAILHIDWEKIAFTDDDKEWIKMRQDYKFNG